MKSLMLTLSTSLLLVSCASKSPHNSDSPSGAISETATQDPREVVRKAVAKEQKNIDKCFEGPSKKDEYFVGRLTYAIEFNNRIVSSIKLVESTFQSEDKAFLACVEKAIKNIELDSQKENLPYNINYPFTFGMDRE